MKTERESGFTIIELLIIIAIFGIIAAIIIPAYIEHKDSSLSTDKLIAELKSSNPNVRLKAISILIRRKNPSVKQPEIVDWVIFSSANLLDDNAEWTDRENAKKYYDAVKQFENSIITDSLIRHLFKPDIRLRTLFLGVKLGIPDSPEKLVGVLMQDGDKSMAEDFLNSGSQELYDGGKTWANEHGYSITTGMGSHRVSWGVF